ncbi:hypothetical protein [Allorhizocola rhizosphaerae]|uniref:hypothetical protein n=1 Tax=Allorhizocola rhizosphaerae TaxID=1872709 RepID=UPI001FE73F2C|nr:hypothetical protein [Allorhizocola rhizosphaerae]
MLGRVLDLRRGALRQQLARGRDQRLSGPRLLLGPPPTVVIATSLADADTATAKRMCDAASEIAYVGEVNSVRVLSAAGTELANGITGLKCLA